jgi:hypothetical protein
MSTPALSRLDVSDYTEPFDKYPADLVEFAAMHNIKLLPLSSMRGQALALMAQPGVRSELYIDRDGAVEFFENIGMETKDAIQQFNKAFGLKRIKMRGAYCLKFPFETDAVDIKKRVGVTVGGEKGAEIKAIKDWWMKNLIDVPADEWQKGHLDPTIPDGSAANMAWQPPIQARYRNRFKWDAMFHKMWPTAEELKANMDKYYTDDEQRIMLELLNKKFA